MPPHLSLNLRERGRSPILPLQLVSDAVVKLQKQSVQLRGDHVLVVARIPDDGFLTVVGAAADDVGLLGTRNIITELLLNICQPPSQTHSDSILPKKIGIVFRPSSINAVQVESGRAIVDNGGRIVVALQARNRIERQVMIDELAQIRIAGRNRSVLRVRLQNHSGSQTFQYHQGLLFCLGKLRGGQMAKQTAESALQQV